MLSFKVLINTGKMTLESFLMSLTTNFISLVNSSLKVASKICFEMLQETYFNDVDMILENVFKTLSYILVMVS